MAEKNYELYEFYGSQVLPQISISEIQSSWFNPGSKFSISFTDVMTAKLSFLYINFPERLLINQSVSHWGGKLRVKWYFFWVPVSRKGDSPWKKQSTLF